MTSMATWWQYNSLSQWVWTMCVKVWIAKKRQTVQSDWSWSFLIIFLEWQQFCVAVFVGSFKNSPALDPALQNVPCSSSWVFGHQSGRPKQIAEPRQASAGELPPSHWARKRGQFGPHDHNQRQLISILCEQMTSSVTSAVTLIHANVASDSPPSSLGFSWLHLSSYFHQCFNVEAAETFHLSRWNLTHTNYNHNISGGQRWAACLTIKDVELGGAH